MALSDWADLDNQLAFASLAAAPDSGITPPSGGGAKVYAFRSLSGTVTGASGLYTRIANFSPTTSGVWAAAALKRIGGAAVTGFAPLLYAAARGHDVNDEAYILGLEDADPYRIVLRKGTIIEGVPVPVTGNYLRRSSQQFQVADDLWHHVALEVLEQPDGEVYLNCWYNDLAVNPVTAPIWQAIPGMAQFIDDRVGHNSGSLPYSGGGYCGFACALAEAIGVEAAVDHVQFRRQV